MQNMRNRIKKRGRLTDYSLAFTLHSQCVRYYFKKLQSLFPSLSRLKTDCSVRETSGSKEVNGKGEMFRSEKKNEISTYLLSVIIYGLLKLERIQIVIMGHAYFVHVSLNRLAGRVYLLLGFLFFVFSFFPFMVFIQFCLTKL